MEIVIATAEDLYFGRISNEKKIATLNGNVVGLITTMIFATSGLMVALHEVGGHGMLGGRLTTLKFWKGYPKYNIPGWMNLKSAIQTPGWKKWPKFQIALFGYGDHGWGYSGWAAPWGKPNALGRLMGEDIQMAWISLAGNLSQWLFALPFVVAGKQVKKKHTAVGSAIETFGVANWLFTMPYPLTVAFKSTQQLEKIAGTGHDFASFAIHISNVTRFSPTTIARTMGFLAVASTPLLLWCLKNRGQEA